MKNVWVASGILAATIFGGGCEPEPETPGEKIEEAGEKMGEAVEEIADGVGDAVDELKE